MSPQISYAQRYEDLHLLRCFGNQPGGCYIDIGAGHPVYDNVSLAFYLRGWSGVTVEPNPWLAELSAAVRPRDKRLQTLVGAAPGDATYYLVEHFHGLSTTIPANAEAAQQEYGKPAKAMPVAMTTLRAICEGHGIKEIDFLKIDVEGAEKAVLSGNDWTRFRPKIVLAEALAPLTMLPAWDEWEPILTTNGYRFAFFDSLNRYYVAEEDSALAERLAAEPASFDGVVKISGFKPAADDHSHPDHRLADLLSGADMVRLPLLSADELVARLTADLDQTQPASAAVIALAYDRVFVGKPSVEWISRLNLSRDATIRDLYAAIVGLEQFRLACGRISASYAW
ncbi:MAG: FkbM family methyltransferase [Pseudomonadota bacterium]